MHGLTTEYNWNRRNVRYTCDECSYQTHWWSRKRLKNCGETVGSWLVFWDEIIHYKGRTV